MLILSTNYNIMQRFKLVDCGYTQTQRSDSMSKKIKISDSDKEKLLKGIEEHSSKYIFNSKNTKRKPKK